MAILSGVLLHTKLLHIVVQGTAEEKLRREHFENIDLYQTYYDRLTQNPSYGARPHLDTQAGVNQTLLG